MEVTNIYPQSNGTRASLHDYVMLPNQAHRPAVEIRVSRSASGGLSVAEFFVFEEVGMMFGIGEKTLNPEQLADLYEVMHHRVHGYDPRGLDPQAGPTRLRLT